MKLLVPLLLFLSLEEPLPDFATILETLKPHLMAQYENVEILKGYTYQRDSYSSELAKDDSIKKTNRAQFEVYYFDQGPFQKLISVNGVPLSEEQLKKQDAEFEKFKNSSKKPGSGGPPWRRRRVQRSPKEQEELLNDVRNAFDFTVIRRETRQGRRTLVVDFKPRQKPQLKTRVAKFLLPNVDGTAWVDETDHVLVKVDVRAINDIKIGFGLIAGISKETQFSREWLKVNDEVWLPERNETRFRGRIFATKGYNLRAVDEFSDYRKFAVETTIKVVEDKQ